jgi:hypothetical protein
VVDGPGILPEVAGRLAGNRLRVADIALRRPSLDDVFLALTGQPTAPPGQTAQADRAPSRHQDELQAPGRTA